MRSSSQDIPRVVIFPPLVPVGTMSAAILLQFLSPLGLLTHISAFLSWPIGALALAAGIGLMAGGGRALKLNGTPVSPSLPTSSLVGNGIYRWTRNPMYVGGCLAMVGSAFLFALDWLAVILPFSLWVLHFGIVKPEERYLEGKFGEQYRRYKASVPRYF